jgi:CHAT domain-containing protein/tetratricopeptide (TPR) repeat protein
MGVYDKAEPLFIQVLELWKKLLGEQHQNYSTTLNNLAALYYNMGQYEKAIPIYKQAIEIDRKVLGEKNPSYANSLNNLATAYVSLAQFEKAEPLYKQAIEITGKALGTENPDYASRLSNMAYFYRSIGQYKRAEELYTQAMEITKKVFGTEHPDYALALNNLARVYTELQQDEKAEQYIKQSMEIWKKTKGEDNPLYALSLDKLAFFYSSQGKYEQAEPLYKQALEIRKKVLSENNPDYAESLNNLAMLYRSTRQYETALIYEKQAIETRRRTLGEDHPAYAASLKNMAGLYAAMDKYETALDYQNRGMTAEQRKIRSIFPYLTENERQIYLDTLLNSQDLLLSICLQNKTNPVFCKMALDWVLKRKGIILSTLLEDRERFRLTQNAETRDIMDKLKIVQSRLAKLVYAGPDNKGAEAFKTECDNLRSEAESLEKSLSTISASYAGNLNSKDADTSSVSTALSKGSALLEMARCSVYNFKAIRKEPKWKDDRIICLILLPGQKSPILIDVGNADAIGKAVSKFRTAIEHRQGEAESGRIVYNLVWAKIDPYLTGINYVFISPDSDLNLLPFACLPVDKHSYLCEKYVINTIASGRDLLRKPIITETRPDFVAFADPEFGNSTEPGYLIAAAQSTPQFRSIIAGRGILNNIKIAPLPATRREALSTKAMFIKKGINTKVYLGANATEKNLKSIYRPGYLLLSTHGYFLSDSSWVRERNQTTGTNGVSESVKVALALQNPMHRSGLVFAGAQKALSGGQIPDGEDDGLLTAEEVVTMDLEGTKLVTLSACKTGLGEVRCGEGVMGLRRAFVMAGCNSLVMSLWNVPDKLTQLQMNSFYSKYLKYNDPVRALAQAQRDMLATLKSQKKPSNPYYWAAFVVTSLIGK